MQSCMPELLKESGLNLAVSLYLNELQTPDKSEIIKENILFNTPFQIENQPTILN